MHVNVRNLREDDLEEADTILRLSFGTFMGLNDPMSFFGDADYIRSRYATDPNSAFAIEVDGNLAGSNFVTNWGSVGFFGPLSIHPNYWNKGIAKHLIIPVLQRLSKLEIQYAGLFTFAQSPKHIYLYQKYDFWPRFLTSIMTKSITDENNEKRLELSQNHESQHAVRYSEIQNDVKSLILDDCKYLTNGIFPGLDLQKEILAVDSQKLGDTILLYDPSGSKLIGIAICHYGKGTEAGSNVCYIKFAAISTNSNSHSNFIRMLNAVELMALEKGVFKITAGSNMERHVAYKAMINYGFKSEFQGVSMHKGNKQGYNIPSAYIIDDWR
ncbi:GNAT family N-acetyltransferase [Candidatus Nitrosocosmicus sp. R]